MNYKNYMSGVSNLKKPYRNKSYQHQPAGNNVQQNAIKELTTTPQQYPQNQKQRSSSTIPSYSYQQTLDNPLVSGVYSKGLVQSNGNKISAAEFALREILKAKDYVDNFTEDRQRRWAGGPGFTGNLQQDRNMLAGIAGQLARYINDLYKSAGQQYGNQ